MGEIVSMQFWMYSWESIYGFVEFQNAENAGKACKTHFHEFTWEQKRILLIIIPETDYVLEPIILIRCHFPVDRQSASTSIDIQTNGDDCGNILDLNDDCIREIFDHLNLMDLFSVAEVCQRFQKNAQKRFAIHHKSVNFFEIATLDVDQMKNFMGTFGPLIEKLSVSMFFVPDENAFLSMVHCFTSVSDLTLHGFTLHDEFVNMMKPVFVRLKKLRLMSCGLSNAYFEVLAYCSELTKLKYKYSSREYFDWPSVHLPKLVNFKYDGYQYAEMKNVRQFLKYNPQLKKIAIGTATGSDTNVIGQIGKRSLIEKLALATAGASGSNLCLTQFSSLRKLILEVSDCVPASAMVRIIRELADLPLEYLDLFYSKINVEIAAAISGLKTLKTLSLDSDAWNASPVLQLFQNMDELFCLRLRIHDSDFQIHDPDFEILDQEDLPNLLQRAKNLQRIILQDSLVSITAEVYKRLLEIARIRSATSPLIIFLDRDSMVDFKECVPKSTIYANKNILIISEISDDFDRINS